MCDFGNIARQIFGAEKQSGVFFYSHALRVTLPHLTVGAELFNRRVLREDGGKYHILIGDLGDIGADLRFVGGFSVDVEDLDRGISAFDAVDGIDGFEVVISVFSCLIAAFKGTPVVEVGGNESFCSVCGFGSQEHRSDRGISSGSCDGNFRQLGSGTCGGEISSSHIADFHAVRVDCAGGEGAVPCDAEVVALCHGDLIFAICFKGAAEHFP